MLTMHKPTTRVDVDMPVHIAANIRLIQTDIKSFCNTFDELVHLLKINVDTPYTFIRSLIGFVVANCFFSRKRQLIMFNRFVSQIRGFINIDSIAEMDKVCLQNYTAIMRQLWGILSYGMRNRFIHAYHQNMYIYT